MRTLSCVLLEGTFHRIVYAFLCSPTRWLGRVVMAIVLTLTIAQVGCQHPVLGRPAFVGASATAGFGASADSDGKETLPVDLAVAFDAVVVAKHATPARYGDALFYRAPAEAADQQIAAVETTDATLLVALDWLFWAAYAPVKQDAHSSGDGVPPTSAHRANTADQAERFRRIDHALALLDRALSGSKPPVIVLGDLPDFGTDPRDLARPVGTIAPHNLRALNEHIHAWAKDRPRVVLLEVSAWPLDATLADGTPYLQSDGLHPTAEGLVYATQKICEALTERKLIQHGDWRRDAVGDATALIEASRASMNAGGAGWLDRASMFLAYRALNDELRREPPNCEAIERHVAALFEPAPQLDEDPSGSGLGIVLALSSTWMARQVCPEVDRSLRRCLDRLNFDIRAARPNLFRLDLWIELCDALDRQEEAEARLTELVAALGPAWGAYQQIIESECRAYRISYAPTAAEQGKPRVRIVAMLGGPEGVVLRGREILRAMGLEADPARCVQRSEHLSFPQTAEPLDNATRRLELERVLRIQEVLQLLLDLRAAAALAVPNAAAAAEELRTIIETSLGTTRIGLAVDTSNDAAGSLFLPNGGVVARGYCEPNNRLQWAFFSSGQSESARIAVEGHEVTIRSESTDPTLNPLHLMLAKKPPIALGLLGRFGAADGVFTIVDGECICTFVDGDSDSPRSRGLEAGDRRALSVCPNAPLQAARPLEECADLAALWTAIWHGAQDAGVDASYPFGVRVDGEFESLTVRLERGADPVGPANAAGDSLELMMGRPLPIPLEPLQIEVPSTSAVIVGVVAPASIARIVRHGAPMRLHAVWTDTSGARHTGEVVAIRGGSSLTLATQVDGAASELPPSP